jgi:hypothetical protein
VKKIEGKEYQAMSGLVYGRAQGIEIGDAIFVSNDELAIDQGRFAGELGSNMDHAVVGSGPVSAMTGEGLDVALVDNDQRPVAVVLDLVKPALSGRRFRHKRGDFRRDEAEWRVSMGGRHIDGFTRPMRNRKDVRPGVSAQQVSRPISAGSNHLLRQ